MNIKNISIKLLGIIIIIFGVILTFGLSVEVAMLYGAPDSGGIMHSLYALAIFPVGVSISIYGFIIVFCPENFLKGILVPSVPILLVLLIDTLQ